MYALVEIKGKQYKAEKGAVLKVDRMDEEAGAKIDIDKVLLLSGDKVAIGSPYVKGASVKAVVSEHGKGKKVIVATYISKKDHRRKIGHRQGFTLLKVEDIVGA